ncbi:MULTISPECIES: hypothetical protein [Streptomyces]|uniref:hypothetical protein n=1 Tax=Streptomyces TaxID=1883 RepID=UPI0005A02D9D|nr:hypothetical protein [Streptomyces venezuelae]APE24935.1 hypothetical protein vnz_30490 [Streptomyces venezuelae]
MLGEFLVAHQAQHAVVFVLVGRDGRCRVQEPVGVLSVLGDPGQLRGVQAVQAVGNGGVRGVRGGGEGGQGWTRRFSWWCSWGWAGRSWSGSTSSMMRITVRLGAGDTTAGCSSRASWAQATASWSGLALRRVRSSARRRMRPPMSWSPSCFSGGLTSWPRASVAVCS